MGFKEAICKCVGKFFFQEMDWIVIDIEYQLDWIRRDNGLGDTVDWIFGLG